MELRSMTDINDWKNTYDFAEGIRLAKKYQASSTLMVLLNSGDSSYSRRKLSEFLDKVNEKLLKSAEKKAVVVKQNQRYLEPADGTAFPPHIQKKVTEKNKMYLEAAHLHSQLEVIPQADTRYKHAQRILLLQKKITRIWNELDYYRENGQELSKKDSIDQKPIAELFKLQSNYQNYIYRNGANGKEKLKKKYEELLEEVNHAINAKTI